MNKETIYIEPNDDITDVLSKLKATKEKIVAIVPPKKPNVLLSAVNVKLIARAAKAEKKAVVLVSTDDALIKLAMTADLPVAPSLKSRPVMPGQQQAEKETKKTTKTELTAEEQAVNMVEAEEDSEKKDDLDEEDDDEGDEDDDEHDEEDDDDEEDEDNDEEDDSDDKIKETDNKANKESKKNKTKTSKKEEKKSKKASKSGSGGWFSSHKAWIIFGVIAIVCLAGFLFWAFKIAPDVEVNVYVQTTSANFSENIVLTLQPADEKAENGVFYIREEKLEKDQSVKFTATGKKDIGESASGEVAVIYYFTSYNGASVTIDSSTIFSLNGRNYTPAATVTLNGPTGKSPNKLSICENYSADLDPDEDYCQISAKVPVKAAAAGEDYNVSANTDGWSSTISGLSVYNPSDISGGTSNIVTVVLQSDIDLALDKMKGESSENSKNELFAKMSNTVMPIEASFKIEATEPKATPGAGEEVKEGVTPQISAKTTYSVLTVDNVRIEEFIKTKANVEEGKRLYSIGDPFVEYFSKSDENTYSAKLKTTYRVGADISETAVLEKIQGEKLGRIKPILKDSFPGVIDAKPEKSYFWVNSVPSNPNQVHINLIVDNPNNTED